MLEELISFFETDKHSEAYHIHQLTTGYYYCRNSTQTKGDPFSLQQHPLMFTVLLKRFSFNREIFIWAPGEQANKPESFSFRSTAEYSFFYFRHFVSYFKTSFR